MKYLVIIEQGPASFGAYVPDLPGCVAVGETADEVKQLIRGAIDLHLADRLAGELARRGPRPSLDANNAEH